MVSGIQPLRAGCSGFALCGSCGQRCLRSPALTIGSARWSWAIEPNPRLRKGKPRLHPQCVIVIENRLGTYLKHCGTYFDTGEWVVPPPPFIPAGKAALAVAAITGLQPVGTQVCTVSAACIGVGRGRGFGALQYRCRGVDIPYGGMDRTTLEPMPPAPRKPQISKRLPMWGWGWGLGPLCTPLYLRSYPYPPQCSHPHPCPGHPYACLHVRTPISIHCQRPPPWEAVRRSHSLSTLGTGGLTSMDIIGVHDDPAHGDNSHVGPSARGSSRPSQEVRQRPRLRSVAFHCVQHTARLPSGHHLLRDREGHSWHRV